MTREAEIRASEQMRDQIADMLHREALIRDTRTPAEAAAGRWAKPRSAILYHMEGHIRAMPGRLAEGEADNGNEGESGETDVKNRPTSKGVSISGDVP